MRRLIYVLPIVVVGVFAAVFWIRLQSGVNPDLVPSPLINKTAPAFSVPLLNGHGTLTASDLKGKVTMFNVFASWCVPCRAEHPILMRIAREGRARIIGMSYKDKPADTRAWLGRFGDPYTKVGTDLNGRTAIDWGVYGVPETFILDATGRIRYKQTGPIDPVQYEQTIAPILKELAR